MGDYEEVFDPILGKNRAKDLFTGSGLLSINGLTPVAQLLAVASAGSDFNIVSSGATHTFNLPTASALNRGALSSADWSTFNNKLSNISGQDHSTLNNLDFASSGHTGFEKSLTFSTGLTRTGDTITTNDSQIVHDNLSGFVANEHIDHSGVNINAGGILSGGGDITTSRTITLNQSDVDHDLITNTHNLTTDIDHDQLLNYVAGEHFLQSAITQISSSVTDGILTTSSGVLGSITDNSTNWNTAYSWGDHSVEGYLKNIVEDTTPQLGGDLDSNGFDINLKTNDKLLLGTTPNSEIYSDGQDLIIRQLTSNRDMLFYVNDGGVDSLSFSIKGDTANVLVDDNNKIIIGDEAVAETVMSNIAQIGVARSAFSGAYFTVASGSQFPFNNGRRARGSLSSLSAMTTGDIIFRMGGGGYDGSSWTTNRASVDFEGSELWTGSANGTRITFKNTVNGTATQINQARIDNDGGIYFYNLLGTTGGSDVRYNTTTKEIFYDTSSQRYKENIVDAPNTDWIYDVAVRDYNRIGSQEIETGVIAEELALVKPELVNYALFEKLQDGSYKLLQNYKNISDYFDISINEETQANLKMDIEDNEITETKTIVKLPEGINNMGFMFSMLKEIQKLKARIEVLEAA